MPLPTRDEAWTIVQEWITNEGLRKHVLSA